MDVATEVVGSEYKAAVSGGSEDASERAALMKTGDVRVIRHTLPPAAAAAAAETRK